MRLVVGLLLCQLLSPFSLAAEEVVGFDEILKSPVVVADLPVLEALQNQHFILDEVHPDTELFEALSEIKGIESVTVQSLIDTSLGLPIPTSAYRVNYVSGRSLWIFDTNTFLRKIPFFGRSFRRATSIVSISAGSPIPADKTFVSTNSELVEYAMNLVLSRSEKGGILSAVISLVQYDSFNGKPRPRNIRKYVAPSVKSLQRLSDIKLTLEKNIPVNDAPVARPHTSDKPRGLYIGIGDSGVDYNHADLVPYFDQDNIGYDLIDNDNLPSEFSMGLLTNFSYHGTHVTGLATKGLDPKQVGVRVARLQFPGKVSKFQVALEKLASSGVKVINFSFGGPFVDSKELNTYRALFRKHADVLFVCAAGNESTDTDVTPHFPSSFTLEFDNVISVGAWDLKKGKPASFTNYGQSSVDVFAPGVDMLSAVPTGAEKSTTKALSGTSMASPVVANEAVKLWLADQRLTPRDIKRKICESGVVKFSLQKNSRCGRLVGAN